MLCEFPSHEKSAHTQLNPGQLSRRLEFFYSPFFRSNKQRYCYLLSYSAVIFVYITVCNLIDSLTDADIITDTPNIPGESAPSTLSPSVTCHITAYVIARTDAILPHGHLPRQPQPGSMLQVVVLHRCILQ